MNIMMIANLSMLLHISPHRYVHQECSVVKTMNTLVFYNCCTDACIAKLGIFPHSLYLDHPKYEAPTKMFLIIS